jgi:hypothetical protein
MGPLEKSSCLLVLAALAAPLSAQARHDTCYAAFVGGELQESGGTGWNHGEWICYPETGWWTQWFYAGRPDPERCKEIHFRIRIGPVLVGPPTDRLASLAINWSHLEFPQTGPGGPPPMPDQEWAIDRRVIFGELGPVWIDLEIPQTGPGGPPPMPDQECTVQRRVVLSEQDPSYIEIRTVAPFVIEEYNPEWVSIGVTFNPSYEGELLIDGEIWHECVPEPATVLLLCGAAATALWRRERRR